MSVAVIGLLSACATGAIRTPLPTNIRIQAPDPSVPRDVAVFSGKWAGLWGGQLDHTLVVEKIEGNTASVIYSHGTNNNWFITQPGFFRARGTIANGVLTVPLRGVTVTYTVVEGGTKLAGRFEGTYPTSGIFYKTSD
jgi:hypothetical protein